jgi:murein DD-endopeptidase MepM/ murein hydrolase activator NlpD
LTKQKTALAYTTAIMTLVTMLLAAAFFNLIPWTSSATDAMPDPEQTQVETPVDLPQPVEPEPEEEPLFEGNINRLPFDMIIDMLGFLESPIAGAKIKMTDALLPGAPRAYRNGTHEGIDFYNGYSGVAIARGTPVLAAADGVVIRIDHTYVEMTRAKRDEYHRISAAAPTTPEDILDKYRGRQVWLEHQGRVITRYAHLDTVSAELSVGDSVAAGQQVGTVGNSGTGPAITNSNTEMHLHFEVWLNGFYLGHGLPAADVRFILRGIFE